MTFQYPRSGLNNTAEYMAAGLPWVSCSTTVTNSVPWRVDFPYVTRDVSVHCATGSVRVGFTENGVNGTNYFLLDPSDGICTFTVRIKTLFVRSDPALASTVSVYAGLTSIEPHHYPVLTGSAIYNSASVVFELGYGKSGSIGAGTGLG